MVAVNEADGATLFNCCTDYRAPNWASFTHLELGGCKDAGPPGDDPHETSIEGGVTFDEAEFFSVYGRRWDGEAEPITDIQEGALAALVVAATLRGISGLSVHLYP